jgi:hypothetical protein
MKTQSLVLIAACLLFFSAGLDAQGTCNRQNTAGTYAVSVSGWATIGVVNNMPVFVPVKGVGTATIDASGKLNGTITSVVAGTVSTIPTAGTIEVTSDCKVTVKASCSSGCEWTLAGVFVHNTKEANLVFTSQTAGGQPAPITATLDLKHIGN